jgi:hypothetical protein
MITVIVLLVVNVVMLAVSANLVLIILKNRRIDRYIHELERENCALTVRFFEDKEEDKAGGKVVDKTGGKK